jgi:hypothetical protein
MATLASQYHSNGKSTLVQFGILSINLLHHVIAVLNQLSHPGLVTSGTTPLSSYNQ